MGSKRQRPLYGMSECTLHNYLLPISDIQIFDVCAVTATRNLRRLDAPELLREVSDDVGYLAVRLNNTVAPKEDLQCLRLAEPP